MSGFDLPIRHTCRGCKSGLKKGHPGLSTEAQVTLILKTLCGFSISEIGHALLASEDSIAKRLGRARKLFRLSGTFVEITDAADIRERLEAVYQAIYLLFNEGYHGSQS